jgi:T1SS-143 domain-containing protein
VTLTATITDADGDHQAATIDLGKQLSIQDDGPILKAGTVTGSVDEGGLLIDVVGTVGNDPGQPTSASGAAGSLTALVNFGADGAGQGADGTSTAAFQFALANGASLAGLGMSTHTSAGTVVAVNYAAISGNVLTAYAGGANGIAVFTLTIHADGSWQFQDLAPIQHTPTGDNIDTLNTFDLSGLVKAVDADGDSVPLSGDFKITIIDDVPLIGAIQNAIMPSVNGTDAHGTWQPSFGADGPSATAAIGIAMGTAPSGETYVITDTGTHNPANEEVFSVKVTSGSTSYTFYEYTHYDATTHSAEMFAYVTQADAQAGLGNNEFFTLTMAANGTYDFHLVSNSLQTFLPFDFTTLPPGNSDYATITNGVFTAQSGTDSIAGRSILIDGYSTSNTDPNSGNKVYINNGGGGGLGVNNGNLDTNETVFFQFNNIVGDSARVGDQSSVTIGVGKANNTFEAFLITIRDDSGTILGQELIKQADGTSVVVDAAHWGVANGALDSTGSFSAFGRIDVENVGGGSLTFNGHSYSFTGNSYDDKILVTSISGAEFIGNTTLTFAPTITDFDGDTASASTNLSISLSGTTNGSGGYNLTGTNTAAEDVVASSHADVLAGGTGTGDTVDYSNSTAGVNVNLATNVVSGGYAAGDTISGFENAVGSSFADTLTAASTGSVLDGGANSTGGTDVLNGGAGNDILIASRAGTDILTGNGGNDTFVLQGNGGANVTIADFNAGDSIVVDVADHFLTISNASAINGATQFNTGAGAPTSGGAAWAESTATDKFYFDATNHNLWFSANGTGSDQVQLAHLSTGVPAAANVHVA